MWGSGACTKVVFGSPMGAQWVADQMTRDKGVLCRVHPCKGHGPRTVWHTTTRQPRPSPTRSKGAPERVAFHKRRAKVRRELPVAVWEGEGGALLTEGWRRRGWESLAAPVDG